MLKVFLHKLYIYGELYLVHFVSLVLKNFFNVDKVKKTKRIKINNLSYRVKTEVDRYWNSHTVNIMDFQTRWESDTYFRWVSNEYPLFLDLMDFGEKLDEKVVLDYGCGTGNDLYRLCVVNNARKVYGMDVSATALKCAQNRLFVHGIGSDRVTLVKVSDKKAKIPLPKNSVDFINCAGVLMHTSDPTGILKELYRVGKKGARGTIMVYNYDSIWLHLLVSYEIMLLKGLYKDLSIEEAFSKTTDGNACPVARCYRPKEFLKMLSDCGFLVTYKGGYFNKVELYRFEYLKDRAMKDNRLGSEHRKFLESLVCDAENGYPKFEGKYAGHAGVYEVFKK